MCITLWLPNELLAEIIQNVSDTDLASLCHVCKLFHALVLPSLLRNVVLHIRDSSIEITDAFCLGIIENPARAESVLSLTLINGSLPLVPAKDLLIQSLKLMRNLESLSIDDIHAFGVVSCLPSLTFPKLSSCFFIEAHPEIWSPHMIGALGYDESWNLHAIEFLSRHPTIAQLRLRSAPCKSNIPAGTLLPEMRYFQGSSWSLALFSKRSLVALRTAWPVLMSSVGRNFDELTSPNITSLYIEHLCTDYVSMAIRHLSAHMPRLEKIKLCCCNTKSSTGMDLELEETLFFIGLFLSRFERLAYVAFNYDLDSLGVDAGRGRRALETWPKLSQTLRGISIGDKAELKVGETWEGCSGEAFDAAAGFF
ncbi:hypothetical protein FB45DRAFT_947848 [Roridomyces roridus]|uniref:F-box domain-containing protein n=1 Tax=Roridomyces roridus TaxID=1738132 RepID=A0AAD7B127_9AGAR|nr:hypothetical protein FB45DRAFT_947848 [Roridomyces roridus]